MKLSLEDNGKVVARITKIATPILWSNTIKKQENKEPSYRNQLVIKINKQAKSEQMKIERPVPYHLHFGISMLVKPNEFKSKE